MKIMSLVAGLVVTWASSAGAAAGAAPAPADRLDNGLTVILRPVQEATNVAVVVLFDLGGDHDPPGRSGRAHLLEHLYCTAAAGDTPARTFRQLMQRYPAGFNQQTGSDYTVLAGVVEAAHLASELEDAAARMSDLRITDADLKREKPRLLAELRNMYERVPSLVGLNHVRARLHPAAQGGRHGGSAEHVKAITRDELVHLWRDYYKPTNAAVVLAGKFDPAEARKLIRKHFGPIPAGKAPPAKPAKPKAETGVTCRVRARPVGVSPLGANATGVVSVGYAAPPPGSADYAPYLVVVSRLFAMSRGRFHPGRVAPIYCPILDDPTTIALQTPLPAGKDAALALRELDQRLQAALRPQVTAQDRVQAIDSMAAYLGTADVPDAMWRQNPYGLAFSAGRRHQLGIDGKRVRAPIQAVTDADLRRLAKSVFSPARRVAVIATTPQHKGASPPARNP